MRTGNAGTNLGEGYVMYGWDFYARVYARVMDDEPLADLNDPEAMIAEVIEAARFSVKFSNLNAYADADVIDLSVHDIKRGTERHVVVRTGEREAGRFERRLAAAAGSGQIGALAAEMLLRSAALHELYRESLDAAVLRGRESMGIDQFLLRNANRSRFRFPGNPEDVAGALAAAVDAEWTPEMTDKVLAVREDAEMFGDDQERMIVGLFVAMALNIVAHRYPRRGAEALAMLKADYALEYAIKLEWRPEWAAKEMERHRIEGAPGFEAHHDDLLAWRVEADDWIVDSRARAKDKAVTVIVAEGGHGSLRM